MGGHVQSGIAACYSIDEYDRDLIKKHEKTRPDKEDDRTRHMLAIGAQTGPVFLTYRASKAVDAIVARVTQQATLFDLTAARWRPAPGMASSGLRESGHRRRLREDRCPVHRGWASSRRVGGARRGVRSASRGSGEHDRVMAVAFPDNQMQVLPYNRVVTDLRGMTSDAFLQTLRQKFTVRDGGPATPSGKGSVAMYLGGKWYTIALPSSGHALDVDLLQSSILEPLLGIADVRTDKRIDFVGGIRGTRELEQLVASGKFAVAFSMYPVSVDDLMRIADAGGIMPPKSTWFEPKLRDGLLSHLI